MVYPQYFGASLPAGSYVQSGMVADDKVEIEAVACDPRAPSGATIIAERVEYLDENSELVIESLRDFTKKALKKRFASGAVGSVVGQIAQLKGCRIVGVAGGSKNNISVSIHRHVLEGRIRGGTTEKSAAELLDTDKHLHTINLPIRIGRRGRETRLILHQSTSEVRPVDRSLLTMIARGYAWRHQLVTGEVTSALEIARRGNVTGSYVSRIINLGFLAPDIIAAIADGLAPIDLTANKLKTIRNIPLDWPSQRQVLGF